MKRLSRGQPACLRTGPIFIGTDVLRSGKGRVAGSPLPAALTAAFSRGYGQSLPGDGIAPFLDFDQEYYLADDILVKSDRMSMAHAVEVRPPFLDHRIIEFAAKLPDASSRYDGSGKKVVFKDLMLPKLPVSVIERKKDGFDIPAHEWFRGPLRPMLLETLEAAEAEHSDLFHFAAIRGYTQLHLERKINVGYHSVGAADVVFMDETMEDSVVALADVEEREARESSARGRTMNRRRSLLIVLLFASAVYLGCILSPPSLMDDVDAVLAQASRTMLSSGDWVTPRLDGVPYLEKPALFYWPMAVSFEVFGVHDWTARIPIALSAVALAGRDCVLWHVGFWPARRVSGRSLHVDLSGAISVHPNPSAGCNPDLDHCFGDVGLSSHPG